MKTFGIITIILSLCASVIRASQSDDIINFIEEKARIKAEAQANSKPTPGQLIFATTRVATKQPIASPITVVQSAVDDIKPTINSDRKSRKSGEEEAKVEVSDAEEKTKDSKKIKNTGS